MKTIYKNCLTASIYHAVMTNIYPLLSYEQSWDGHNFSFQNSAGARGTITFADEFCVGAIRNESVPPIFNLRATIMAGFPNSVIEKAKAESLQYLLTNNGGTVMPTVTSAFWADINGIYCSSDYKEALSRDIELFNWLVMPCEEAFVYWHDNYECMPETTALIEYLINEKMKDFSKKVILGDTLVKALPGNGIDPECEESLSELNIFLV